MSDAPTTREEAVELLRSRGLRAVVRDWATSGSAIVVFAGPSGDRGIEVFERAVCIVEHEASREWSVVRMELPEPLGKYGSLSLACDGAIHALGPGWRVIDAMLEVEDVFAVKGRTYVAARHLAPGRNFIVGDESQLDGRAVERWLDIPRALDASGRCRLDAFVFCLRDPADREHFRIGATVQLTSPADRGT